VLQFFDDFYNFEKKYWNPRNEDEYWDGLLQEAETLGEKYPQEVPLIMGFVQKKDEES